VVHLAAAPAGRRAPEAWPTRGICRSWLGVGVGKKSQDFADGVFPPGGFGQRQVRLDLVRCGGRLSA
jgi:hypothetical protein